MSAENTETQILEYLPTTCQDIDNCSFSHWYPRFKSHTFKSEIIPLTQEFVDYLNAEGIYLPEDGYSENNNKKRIFFIQAFKKYIIVNLEQLPLKKLTRMKKSQNFLMKKSIAK